MIKHRGDGIGILAVFTDRNGNLVDPDNHEINVYDPDETLKAGPITSVTKISVGVFEYYYVIPADATYGDWNVTWKGQKGTYPETEIAYFTVKRKPGDT